MKIQLFDKQSPLAATADGKWTVKPIDFVFSKQTDGGWKCVIPVKLPNSGVASDTRDFVARVPVTIKGERTVNRDNRARIMLKVSLPYTALSPDVADDAVVANQFDTRRSGGELSAHIVLSAPAALVDDYRGNRGSTCERAAIAQVNGLLQMLGVVLGPSMPCILAEVDKSNSKGAWKPTVSETGSNTGELVTTSDSPATAIPPITAKQAGRGEIPSVDFSDAAIRDEANPLVQGLLGGDVLSNRTVAAAIALLN